MFFKNSNNTAQLTGKRKSITVVICILLAALIGVGIFFACREIMTKKTQYGNVNYIQVTSKNEIKILYSAIYKKREILYDIDKTKSVIIRQSQNTEKTYPCEIKSVKYDSLRSEGIRRGTLEIDIEVKDDFVFENEKTYTLTVQNGAITERKTGNSIGEITSSFEAAETFDGNYSTSAKTAKSYELKEVRISSGSIEQEDGSYYIVLKLDETQLVNINKQELEKNQTFLQFGYKDETIQLRILNKDIQCFYDETSGVVTVKCKIDKENVVTGVEYVVSIAEGFLISDDASTGSKEAKISFTFMA